MEPADTTVGRTAMGPAVRVLVPTTDLAPAARTVGAPPARGVQRAGRSEPGASRHALAHRSDEPARRSGELAAHLVEPGSVRGPPPVVAQPREQRRARRAVGPLVLGEQALERSEHVDRARARARV